MSFPKIGLLALLPALACMACSKMNQNNKEFKADDMMIRMAEIEIDSAYFDEYIAILKEESAASVRLKDGIQTSSESYSNPNAIIASWLIFIASIGV